MFDAAKLLGGAALMLTGTLLIAYVAFSDLAHAGPVHWFGNLAVLAAAAIVLMLIGGLLVAL